MVITGAETMQPTTYIINLDRSPDRLAAMQVQFEALALPFKRIQAVDGNDVILPDQRIDLHAFSRRHHAPLRRGEIGCYLSHVRVLQVFVASGEPMGVIMEDDVVPTSALPQVLGKLAAAPEAWDMVKLFATHMGGILTRTPMGGHRLASLAFRHGSSAAYVVNRRAAGKLLDGLLPMTVPYDHEFDRAWKYDLKLRVVLPFPVYRARTPSTIGASTKRLHKPWHRQLGMVAFRGCNDVQRVWWALNEPTRSCPSEPFASGVAARLG
jgi:glycosyl transferase family 25